MKMLNLAAKRMDSAALVLVFLVLCTTFQLHVATCFISYSFHSFLPTLDLLQA